VSGGTCLPGTRWYNKPCFLNLKVKIPSWPMLFLGNFSDSMQVDAVLCACRCGNQVGGQRQQHQLCAEQTAVPRADTEQLINDVRTRRETTTYAASFRIHSVNQNRKRPYFRSPFSFQLVNLVFWCSLIHTHRQMDRVWIFMITEHFRILMCDMMHSVVSDYRMHHIAH